MPRKGLDVSLPASQVDEAERASPLPVRPRPPCARTPCAAAACVVAFLLRAVVGPSVGGEPLSLVRCPPPCALAILPCLGAITCVGKMKIGP